MRTSELAELLEGVRNPSMTVEEISRLCRTAAVIVRRSTPPRNLPNLRCEYGTFTIRPVNLSPYQGLGIVATESQPQKTEGIWMMREFALYQVTGGFEVDIRFPKIAQHGLYQNNDRLNRWRRQNSRNVKSILHQYFDHHLPLLEDHWEYTVLLTLLREIDRLSGAARDVDEVNRLLTAAGGTAAERRRYREAAGTLHARNR